MTGFTKEENFCIRVTKVICDWKDGSIDATTAMNRVEELDIRRLTESSIEEGVKLPDFSGKDSGREK